MTPSATFSVRAAGSITVDPALPVGQSLTLTGPAYAGETWTIQIGAQTASITLSGSGSTDRIAEVVSDLVDDINDDFTGNFVATVEGTTILITNTAAFTIDTAQTGVDGDRQRHARPPASRRRRP